MLDADRRVWDIALSSRLHESTISDLTGLGGTDHWTVEVLRPVLIPLLQQHPTHGCFSRTTPTNTLPE